MMLQRKKKKVSIVKRSRPGKTPVFMHIVTPSYRNSILVKGFCARRIPKKNNQVQGKNDGLTPPGTPSVDEKKKKKRSMSLQSLPSK